MRRPWLFSLAAVLAANVAFAQDPAPVRGVWIASAQGAVSFLAAGADQSLWSPAELNRPLVVGDQVATVDDGTADLRVDSDVLHLGPGTAIEFGRIEGNVLVIDLKQGSLDASAARLAPGEVFEVDTQNLSMTMPQPGSYSFQLDPQGYTKNIVVHDGLCQAVSATGQSFTVQGGQQANVSGAGQVAMSFQSLPRLDSPQPPPPAPGPQDPGQDTLAQYGDWQSTPNNGTAWYPNVPADWAPYTQGQWDYIEPGGWTWVDSEPWGFTPFHYGRWGFAGRWFWIPGEPVYSPALVGWMGEGPGMSGMVGWFPLGPGEPYIGVGGYYPAGRFRYANVGFATVVRRDTFVNAQPVYRSRVFVSRNVLLSARVNNYAAVAPTRLSVVGSRRAYAHPSPYVTSRAVVARTAHAVPALALDRRQQAWNQAPGRPLATQQIHPGGYGNTAYGNRNVRLAPRTPGYQTPRPQYRPPVRPTYPQPRQQPRPQQQQPPRQTPPRPAYHPPAPHAPPPAPARKK